VDAREQRIIILDFGSQYTQLIARRIRELKVYCEIYPYDASIHDIQNDSIAGLILSGSPASVHDDPAPVPHRQIFDGGIPILGICYGCQILALENNGRIGRSTKREYGHADLTITDSGPLLAQIPSKPPLRVWMSHGDHLESLPDTFEIIASTPNVPIAAIGNETKRQYGVQFHPEVKHTEHGLRIIENFVKDICGCKQVWTPSAFIGQSIQVIQDQIGTGKVICGLSGGVDSAIVAMLLNQAVNEQLIAVFIDNGVLRSGEAHEVTQYFGAQLGSRFLAVDASDRFLDKLSGVTDPEKKRKIIGEEFIAVFEEQALRIGKIDFLAQGTLYPDVIESVSVKGPSATIKSHHNVGGLPEKMRLKLVEPLRSLFKDEVREVGLELGLPEAIIWRQPFPGPGLAVRILGEITPERLRIVRDADSIVREEIFRAGLMREIWQAFAVLLPIQTVGVMGDERTYEHVCAIRAVNSTDAMTADWTRLPHEILGKISTRISNEVPGINRVVYDISSKPPATIEWE